MICFRDSTCCIVKPQAFLDGKLGAIVDCIQEAGFGISGLEVIRFDRVKASEFHEVYNGVLYDFADMVTQLQSGPSVALEISMLAFFTILFTSMHQVLRHKKLFFLLLMRAAKFYY